MVPECNSPLEFFNNPILYQDEFCKLTEEHLVIKRYFFGTLKPQVIRLKEIRIVYFDEQKYASVRKYSHRRVWGRSTSVYWAADFKRCLPSHNNNRSDVIIDVEDGLLKGFTVVDVQRFLGFLRLHCQMSTIIVDNLNISQ